MRAKFDEQRREQMPGLVTRVYTAATAFFRDLTVGVELSEEKVAGRRSICNACEFRDPVEDRCLRCGCLLKGQLMNKLRMSEEQCPIGKW
jgi:hypothetical protein